MGLVDKLQSVEAKRIKRNGCAYQAMYNALNPADQKAIDEAWAKGYSVNEILTALRSEGIKSSNESIRRHRKNLCACQEKK
jgi:hypothetical protein